MRILHVITGLKKAAGTSVFCGELCNQLVARGHEVTVAVVNPVASNIYPLDPRIHLVALGEVVVHSCSCRKEDSLHSRTTTRNYNLIHIHALWSPILHKVAKWARRNRIPIVWSTHGMTAPWAMRHKWWKKCLVWWLYQKRDLKRAQLIHCTSDLEMEWNGKLGFKRTFWAPLGTVLQDGEARPRRMSGVAKGVKVLLFVGRIYPVKALDRLIEAFARAIRSAPCDNSWTLRLVGPDQAGHMAELTAICGRLGLSCSTPAQERPGHSVIQFAGPKYGLDLDAEYANCDALALVSHTENFGATVVDAMARGKPVVTSTQTPWKVVEDRNCGWWVSNDIENLAAALVDMMKRTDTALASMGDCGRKLVEERYTWSAVCDKILDAYERIC